MMAQKSNRKQEENSGRAWNRSGSNFPKQTDEFKLWIDGWKRVFGEVISYSARNNLGRDFNEWLKAESGFFRQNERMGNLDDMLEIIPNNRWIVFMREYLTKMNQVFCSSPETPEMTQE